MDLEQAMDELYGAAPEDFVTERTRLAKALRNAGLGEDAERLAKLRKPSLAAWVLNQLSRRERRDVDLLLDAGHRLREAQKGVLSGAERDAFEQARAAEQTARTRLIAAGDRLLRSRGTASGAASGQVAESLRAAAISEPGRELLARGRFTEPLRAQGFELVSELAAGAVPRRSDDREERKRAEAELRDAKARLRVARGEADHLGALAAEARRLAEAAHARVEAAEAAVAAAEEKLRGPSPKR